MGSRRNSSITSRDSKPRSSIGFLMLDDDDLGQKSVRKIQTNGFSSESSLNSCVENDSIKRSFDGFVSIFSEVIFGSECFRPLPPMIVGESVDLYKLYLHVKEKGGYKSVSDNGLWSLVAEESGLGSQFASAAKLIYNKYLDVLDRWIHRNLKDSDPKGDFGAYLMELEPEFKRFLVDISVRKNVDEEYPHFDLKSGIGKLSVDLEVEEKKYFANENDNDNENNENGDIVSDCSRKRRRVDLLSRMLNWVSEVAKDPLNLDIGTLPELSTRESCAGDEVWNQVLLVREAMFLNRSVDSNAEHTNSQKKHKMHPSMYEDQPGPGNLSAERSRCSQRLLSAKKPAPPQPSPEPSSSQTQSDSETHPKPCTNRKKGQHDDPDSSTANSLPSFCNGDFVRKKIPVGPFFQALVPEWTGKTIETDPKWLGTPVWPLGKGEKIRLLERDPIGKGRQDSCGCVSRDSAECIRFHIAEKRVKVGLELGSAFIRWQFHRMGEEVMCSWTPDEEKKFKAIVKMNPASMDKCFWDHIFKYFPSKSREDLVSYYFNVFLLRRRSYQNRFTPDNIDSDDDESEFGGSTSGFGHDGVKSPSSIFYSPNKAHANSKTR